MAGPPTARTDAGGALDHLAAAALAALDGAGSDPTMDELADAIEARGRPRPPDRPRVLLVDASLDGRKTLAAGLVDGGCEVIATLRSGITVAYAARTLAATVVVTELDLPPAGALGGLMVVATLTKECPGVPVLVVATPEQAHLAGRAVVAGARRVLPKSDLGELVAAVHAEHAGYVRATSPRGGRRRGRPASGGGSPDAPPGP
jgi:CheY-like chemotaxis protein